MKKNSKLVQKKFIVAVHRILLELGAIKQPTSNILDCTIEFKLETIAGNLNISLRKEQECVFSVFSRFDEVDRAKVLVDCNPFSGKYNIHLANDNFDLAIERVEMFFGCLIEK